MLHYDILELHARVCGNFRMAMPTLISKVMLVMKPEWCCSADSELYWSNPFLLLSFGAVFIRFTFLKVSYFAHAQYFTLGRVALARATYSGLRESCKMLSVHSRACSSLRLEKSHWRRLIVHQRLEVY